MIQEVQISVLPEDVDNEKLIRDLAQEACMVPIKNIQHVAIVKRSVDARKAPVKYQLKLQVFIDEPYEEKPLNFIFQKVSEKSPVVYIVGSGPAGLFAALEALENGIKPIVFERGKDVRARRKDLAAINKEGKVNPESNYCYGEGGAGTYSDGKLYTRSKKRGNVQKVLEMLVFFGADPDILVNTHPHIGTNKLPQLITNIREAILAHGGEVHFDSKLTDIIISNHKVTAFEINHQHKISCEKLMLATGHSARDIYTLLDKKKIALEFKPFALGVRIEHPQELIDSIQYKCENRGEFLPPAAYSLVQQARDRGVYSFCMCPGGIIAPCATDEGEVVTNGWSPSKRNNPYSNSGIVTEVRWEDIPEFHSYGALAGMYFQKKVEKDCWEAAGKNQKVPAQRLMDFLNDKKSVCFPKTSYHPGIVSVELKNVLPNFIVNSLKEGFSGFGKKMKGYLTNEAVLHATESRTSSPVRIPRERDSFEHTEIKGLYPIGEGAGYAGGIASAAIDGQRCIEAIVATLDPHQF